MNPSRRWIWILVPFLGTWGACKDNSRFGAVPLTDYCTEYAAVVCHAAEQCDCLQGYTVEACILYITPECETDVETPVSSGLRTYDPGRAGECLNGVENVLGDCSFDSDSYPSACDTMLPGAVAESGTCQGDGDCLPGLECWNDICTEMPGEGDPCLEGQNCASGFFCGDDTNCHAYRGDGQPCPEGDEACASDLYCDSRTTTCEPYLGHGDECAHAGWACDSGLYCTNSAPRTCEPYPGSGQSCADSYGDCADGLYCDAAEICQPFPGSGESCADSYGDCADGLYCDSAEICQPKKADNQPCTDDVECLSDNCTSDVCATTVPTNCPL